MGDASRRGANARLTFLEQSCIVRHVIQLSRADHLLSIRRCLIQNFPGLIIFQVLDVASYKIVKYRLLLFTSSHSTWANPTALRSIPLCMGRYHCTRVNATINMPFPLHAGLSHCTWVTSAAHESLLLYIGQPHFTWVTAQKYLNWCLGS